MVALVPTQSLYAVTQLKEVPKTPMYSYEIKERLCYNLHGISEEIDQIQASVVKPPIYLEKIKQKVESSKEMLLLKYNWDDNGAQPINPIIFDRVTHFLESYAERIYDVCGKILDVPEIVPINDGSIDLEWNLDNSNFLINFKNTSEEIAFYYGEYKEGEKVIFDTNGQINTGTVKDKFASYLSDLS